MGSSVAKEVEPVLRWALMVAVFLAWLLPAQAAEPMPGLRMVVSQMDDDPVLSVKASHIMREAYRRLGIELRSELLPRERALMSADSGETDGDLIRAAGIDARYINLVRVPEPVITFDAVAFTAGLKFTVDGWDSLRPYSLCIMRGMKIAEQGTEGMQRLIANTTDQAVLMLSAGRCQVAVLGHQVWLDIERLQAGPLRALDPPIASVPLYHYVHRRHAELVPRLADALRAMRNDGAFAALLAGGEDDAVAAARRRSSSPDW